MTFTDLFYIAMTSIGAATIYYAARGAHVAHKRLDDHNRILQELHRSVLKMDKTRELVVKDLKRIRRALGLDDDHEDRGSFGGGP